MEVKTVGANLLIPSYMAETADASFLIEAAREAAPVIAGTDEQRSPWGWETGRNDWC